jgi:hypothetical protein
MIEVWEEFVSYDGKRTEASRIIDGLEPFFKWELVKTIETQNVDLILQYHHQTRNIVMRNLTQMKVVCFCDFLWRDHNIFPVLTSISIMSEEESEQRNRHMLERLVRFNKQRLEAFMWLQYCIKQNYGKFLDKRLIPHICNYLLYYITHDPRNYDDYSYYTKKFGSNKKIKN